MSVVCVIKQKDVCVQLQKLNLKIKNILIQIFLHISKSIPHVEMRASCQSPRLHDNFATHT